MKKKLLLICFISLTSLFSLRLAYTVGEKFFFDKLFYQKDPLHGYVNPNEDWSISKFESRNSDLIALQTVAKIGANPGSKVLGSNDENTVHQMLDWCKDGDLVLDRDLGSQTYDSLIARSFTPSSRNYCIFQKILPLLPKENMLYINFDDFRNTSAALKSYATSLQNNGLIVLSTQEYYKKHNAEYIDVFKPNSYDKFSVSPKDGHPSALANKLFTDELFDEILKNKNWNF